MAEQTTYGYLIDMVEHRYFRAVDEKNMDEVLDCFNDDAIFTIQTSQTVHTGREGIRTMFENLFSNFEMTTHKHFHHVADPENNRVASQFVVDFLDPDGKRFSYTNCNFWYLEGEKFQRVFVYMSDENVLV